eukprot:1724632-Rhodomonas_salina.2
MQRVQGCIMAHVSGRAPSAVDNQKQSGKENVRRENKTVLLRSGGSVGGGKSEVPGAGSEGMERKGSALHASATIAAAPPPPPPPPSSLLLLLQSKAGGEEREGVGISREEVEGKFWSQGQSGSDSGTVAVTAGGYSNECMVCIEASRSLVCTPCYTYGSYRLNESGEGGVTNKRDGGIEWGAVRLGANPVSTSP